jgi:capsular polysaccharide biosynthesis protein
MIGSDAFRFVRRWWWLMLLGVSLAALSTLVVSVTRLPRTYQAHARLLIVPGSVANADVDLGGGLPADQLGPTYASIIQTGLVLNPVITATGLSADQITSQLSVVPVSSTQLLEIDFRSTNPETAASVANAITQAAVDQVKAARVTRLANLKTQLTSVAAQAAAALSDRSRELADVRDAGPDADPTGEHLALAQAALNQAQQDYANAIGNLDSLTLSEAHSTDVLRVVDLAAVPTTPVAPQVTVNVFIASVLGLLVAIGVALIIDRLGNPLLTESELRHVPGLPISGVLPEYTKQTQQLLANDELAPQIAESFRMLRAELLAHVRKDSVTYIAVTSRETGAGKSTLAHGLAVSLSLAGFRVRRLNAGRLSPRRLRQDATDLAAEPDAVMIDTDDMDLDQLRTALEWVDVLVWVVDARLASRDAVRESVATLQTLHDTPVLVAINRLRSPRAALFNAPGGWSIAPATWANSVSERWSGQ